MSQDAGNTRGSGNTGESGETNRGVVLRQRPHGLLKPEDIAIEESPIPELAHGEALLKVDYIGMDATVRSWLNASPGYLPPVEIGEVVRAASVGRIVASKCEAYKVGDVCTSLSGWQQYSICRDDFFTTLLGDELADPATGEIDEQAVMALYGSTGATAYFGLLEAGRPEPGQTVVVSGAAGATGSIVGQIAKIAGCRVIGTCGSDEKCRVLVDELGFDAAINYRVEDVPSRLKELCPDRIHVFFDNVGGPILDAVLGRLAVGARIVLCGAISGYNEERKPPGPPNYVNLIQMRASMIGYLNIDDVPRYPEAMRALAAWHRDGKLRYRAEVFTGLESAVDALNSLFTGGNTGKVMLTP